MEPQTFSEPSPLPHMKLSTPQSCLAARIPASTEMFSVDPHPLGSSLALRLEALHPLLLFSQPPEQVELTGW